MTATISIKSQLGKTAEDHKQEGKAPPSMLVDNQGKTLEEILSDCHGLNHFIEDQIRDVEDAYKAAVSSRSDGRTLEGLLRNFLGPNISYLREIGKLPREFENLYPYEKFKLPQHQPK